MGTPNVSLWNNGTSALLGAIKGLDVQGQVITTPFTFPATVHAIAWLGLEPVFADIDPASMTLDPRSVAEAITPRTTAILGVHLYGQRCDTEALAALAGRHHLRLIYDGAHCFGGSIDDLTGAALGDATMFSFHATKLVHTAEGGALVTQEPGLTDRCKLLGNFGIASEDEVVDIGINGKLNELEAALGLLSLEGLSDEIGRRDAIAEWYEEALEELCGISIASGRPTDAARQYLTIRVDPTTFGVSRDDLYRGLRAYNVFARRYFSPLCSHFETYRRLPSARPEMLPNAERAASECLVLPFHGDLTEQDVTRICGMISSFHG
jgi:dTDP-4-amino-4,6-dideoxygalactose transaminase